MVDVTATSPSLGWAAGGMVSTAGEVSRFLSALLGGELLPAGSLGAMLTTVPADGIECDAYGLGLAELTSVGGVRSRCVSAWGHQSFALGYTAVAVSSRDGRRQVARW